MTAVGALDPEHRRRIAAGMRRYRKRERDLGRLGPGELRELERTGNVAPRLIPYVAGAQVEAADVIASLGGAEMLSPQQHALVRDLARLGVLASALVARALQREEFDLDEVGKVATLVAGRRSILSALGLRRIEKTVDLTSYLEQRAAAAVETIEAVPQPEVAQAADRSADGQQRDDKGGAP